MQDKVYSPKEFEEFIYRFWEIEGCFRTKNNFLKDDTFCIVLPPPNITGNLHIGHAFQHVIMDILIRYKKMQGKNVLWQFGVDHAGIAAQMLLESMILNIEGKKRNDYSRSIFVKKMWNFKNKYSSMIINQMRKLGASIDWKRKYRFTMDRRMRYSVKKAFIDLYKKGLIYRGKKLVNWDTKLCTVISNLEVYSKKKKGFMWYFRYLLCDGEKDANGFNYLLIGTTRPETIFGDVAVAVNPNDQRYINLIGKYVLVPLVNRKIPILCDEFVDISKSSSGCVKVSPAHDFNDYELGKRHNLLMVNIFTFNGHIRNAGEVYDKYGNIIVNNLLSFIPSIFRGLDRFEARKLVVSECSRLGFIDSISKHDFTLPYGDRSDTVIEPMITSQWYLRTTELVKDTINVVKKGEIVFFPKKYQNIFFNWMNNMHDWCISRQLWWGHRIPVWYDNDNCVYVGHSEFEVRKRFNLSLDVYLRRESDVLDTWFSSSLWTFGVLGWPKNTNDFCIFHPVDVMVSGFDIIFFWISRMIMLTVGLRKTDIRLTIPFKTVYITGLICDNKGKKMSKTKGNIIDPIDIIDGISFKNLINKYVNINYIIDNNDMKKYIETIFPKGIKSYGSDVLRFSLSSLSSNISHIKWYANGLDGCYGFCNKLWHAGRFIFICEKNLNRNIEIKKEVIFSVFDRWILIECNKIIKLVSLYLDIYRFDLASKLLYKFVWHEFCDWYLEFVKVIINIGNKYEVYITWFTLLYVFDLLLRILHPFIPFITEFIWQKLKLLIEEYRIYDIFGYDNNNRYIKKGNTILSQSFPLYDVKIFDGNGIIFYEISMIKKMISFLRFARLNLCLNNKSLITLYIYNVSLKIEKIIIENVNFIKAIGRLESVRFLYFIDKKKVLCSQILDKDVEMLIIDI